MSQANFIHDYNQYIGDVDLLGNGITNYRVKVRSKIGGGHYLSIQWIAQ